MGFLAFQNILPFWGLHDTKWRVRPILIKTGINEPDIPQGYGTKGAEHGAGSQSVWV